MLRKVATVGTAFWRAGRQGWGGGLWLWVRKLDSSVTSGVSRGSPLLHLYHTVRGSAKPLITKNVHRGQEVAQLLPPCAHLSRPPHLPRSPETSPHSSASRAGPPWWGEDPKWPCPQGRDGHLETSDSSEGGSNSPRLPDGQITVHVARLFAPGHLGGQ